MMPGAITEIGGLRDARMHYDVASDTIVFRNEDDALITVTALPRIDPMIVMRVILAGHDPNHTATKIKQKRIASYQAILTEVDKKIGRLLPVVVQTDDLNLLIIARNIDDAEKHEPTIEDLVRSIGFAPGAYPEWLLGSFHVVSDPTSPAAGRQSQFGSVTKIETYADGTFIVSTPHLTGGVELFFDDEGSERGLWEVRGNRLLSFVPPESFANFRLEVGEGHLVLHDARSEQIRLVREDDVHIR